nr:MAG: signal peptidase I [Actinomycetota bacterium]
MNVRSPEPGAWTARRALATLGTVLFWIVVAIDVWYIWPTTLGGQTSFVVVSGSSMEPTYFGGDLVIARKMEPSVGDVIVYAPTELGGSQIVHRIIGGSAEDGWVVKGDNNSFIDPFEPTADEVRGVVLVHYADMGRVTALMLNPLFWASFIIAALVIYLWFSGDDCEDDEDDDEDEPTARSADPGADSTVADDADASGLGADDAQAEEALQPALALAPGPGAANAGIGARVTAFVSALLVSIGIGVSPAAAAQLDIRTPLQPQVFSVAACADPSPVWDSTTTATGATSSQVTISGIAAGCRNKTFTVYLHDSAGAVLATMTGTPTGASHSFTMASGSYTVAQVAHVVVKVDGWLFPTAWTAPSVPSTPAISCVAINPAGKPTGGACTVTVTNVTFWDSGIPGVHNLQIDYAVQTNQNRWEVTINFNDPSWAGGGFTPTYVGSAYNVIKAPDYACSSLPVFKAWKAAGNVSWENNAVIFASNQPGVTNGTQALCP